jgi:hypothetical protein
MATAAQQVAHIERSLRHCVHLSVLSPRCNPAVDLFSLRFFLWRVKRQGKVNGIGLCRMARYSAGCFLSGSQLDFIVTQFSHIKRHSCGT